MIYRHITFNHKKIIQKRFGGNLSYRNIAMKWELQKQKFLPTSRISLQS